MQKPDALRPGDRVAVVAPASPFGREEFELGLATCRALGYEPVPDDTVFDRSGFVAGPPEVRAAALRRVITDRSVRGIFCARGGYGSAQVLPYLDAGELRAARKVFVGYSDLTALLTFHTVLAGLVSFHGPTIVAMSAGGNGFDRASLVGAVGSSEPLGLLEAPGLEGIRPGDARGPLFGGTLTQLVASFGTPFAFDPPAGHILFLDEVGERPYRLDRMLTQLRLSGVLQRTAGVVIGELPRCDEPEGQPRGLDVVRDVFAGFQGPVVAGFPSGHSSAPARTLPLGVQVRLDASASPRLVVEEAAVR